MHLKKTLLFLTIISFITPAVSSVRNFETGRLKSTAGAGVGSILMDEATFLNPAPLALYHNGGLYLQKLDTKVGDDSKNDLSSYAAAISDGNGHLKGSVSFAKIIEDSEQRNQIAIAFAHMVGARSSLGITYRQIKDKILIGGSWQNKNKFNPIVIGSTHAVNESFTLGLIIIDPLKEIELENRVIAGLQYVYKDFIGIIIDIGTNYNESLNENLLYRVGLQIKLFNDFFARTGFYDDKSISERGNGIGIGWVQPRLVLEFGLKNIRRISSEVAYSDLLEKYGKLRESSFSFSYKF